MWNFPCDLLATGSLDSTACVWDMRQLDKALYHIGDHTDEVLDVAFDSTGKRLATASNDCTARVWDVKGDLTMLSAMVGHTDEVSKVCYA